MKKLIICTGTTILSLFSYYFIQGWYNVIPWTIAALTIGYISKSRRECIVNGALFGYFLFLVYILFGYSGKTDTTSIVKFTVFNLLFSLVGAIAGIIGSYIGYLLRGSRLINSQK